MRDIFIGVDAGTSVIKSVAFEAEVVQGEGRLILRLSDTLSLDYPDSAFAPAVRDAIKTRERVVIGIRPYAVRRVGDGLAATVSANQWLGDQTHIAADFAGGSLVLVEHDRTRLELGAPILVRIEPSSLHVFDAGDGQAISHGTGLA